MCREPSPQMQSALCAVSKARLWAASPLHHSPGLGAAKGGHGSWEHVTAAGKQKVRRRGALTKVIR